MYISENIKIICAICNKFFRPLSSGAAEEDEIIAAKMKFLSKEINSLKSFMEKNLLQMAQIILIFSEIYVVQCIVEFKSSLELVLCLLYMLRL
jgi:hypothetical protein